MNYPTEEVIRAKAQEFAEQSVYDWKDLDEPTKDWYIRSIIEIWKQNPKVMQAVFREQVN